jgi:hypothetical protein
MFSECFLHKCLDLVKCEQALDLVQGFPHVLFAYSLFFEDAHYLHLFIYYMHASLLVFMDILNPTQRFLRK